VERKANFDKSDYYKVISSKFSDIWSSGTGGF